MRIVTDKDVTIPDPDHFRRNPACLEELKIIDLRNILKHYKAGINFKSGRIYAPPEFQYLRERFKTLYDFALVGTKAKLAERIRAFFHQHEAATKVQQLFRGFLVRMVLRLRGPALRCRSLCVNTHDGCTLEPLENISAHNFYSYKDADNFIYGFELQSLTQMISISRCLNPFNRAKMDLLVLKNLIRMTCLWTQAPIPAFARLGKPIYVPEIQFQRLPVVTTDLPEQYNVEVMIQRMRDIRARTVPERVATLFMEIDQLGHYTQPGWFTALDSGGLIRYLRYLQDFWMYRSHLSQDVKLRICPLWDPFIALLRGTVSIYELTEAHAVNVCLTVMEDMVFTGVDLESRTLGSFQVLTSLTLVSPAARQSMFYLYESVSY